MRWMREWGWGGRKGIECRVGKYGKEKQNSRSNFSLCSLLIFRCSVIGSEHSWRMGGKRNMASFVEKKFSMAEGKNNILYAEKLGTDGWRGGGRREVQDYWTRWGMIALEPPPSVKRRKSYFVFEVFFL